MTATAAAGGPGTPIDPSSPKTAMSVTEERCASVIRFRPPKVPGSFSASSVNKENFPGIENCSAVLGPDATNSDLFNTLGKPFVDELVSGKNCSIAAYGQSSSGKTHSIFGYPGAPGLIPHCVNYLFQKCTKNKRAMRFRVSVSVVEVYCEEIRDLIPSDPNDKEARPEVLELRENNHVFFLPDVRIKVCSDAESLLRVVDRAFRDRTSGSSAFNVDRSSRSHAICTISLAAETNVRGQAPVIVLSRLNFVDLCGSEVLTQKYGAQQQQETKSINLSLFKLQRVVGALAEKAGHIPYNESKLTKLLKATLSPTSMNAILCTASLDPADSTFTSGTISFGTIAQRIEQQIERRVFLRSSEGKVVMKKEADEDQVDVDAAAKKQKKEQEEAAAAGIKPPVATQISVPTRQGNISGWLFARPGVSANQVIASGKVGLALHAFGGGCSGSDMEDMSSAAVEVGSCEGVFALDMPGFGNTPGNRQTSRTESLMESGGPMEIVIDALDYITDSKKSRHIVLIGWDWGGNMALSLAISPYKSRIKCVILFHPSWTSQHESLAAVKAPVLMLWLPSDTLHLYKHGQKMAKLIKTSKLVALKLPAGKTGERSLYYNKIFGICADQTKTFLKSHDPALKPAKATGKTTSPSTTTPKTTTTTTTPSSTATAAAGGGAGRKRTFETDSEEEEDYEGGEDVQGGMNDRYDSGDLASLEDLSDFSRESSFLGQILLDPEVVDAALADQRAKRLKAEARRHEAAVQQVGTSDSLFETLAQLKLAGVEPGHAPSQHMLKILNAIHKICKRSEEVRLTLAYCLLGRNAPLRSSIIGAIGLAPTVLPYAKAEYFVKHGMLSAAPQGCDGTKSWFANRLQRYLPGRWVMLGLPSECLQTSMRDQKNVGRLLKGIDSPTLKSKFAAVSKGNRMWSYRAQVVAPVSATHVRVAVEVVDNSAPPVPLDVHVDDLEHMNRPTAFQAMASGSSNSILVFEDAIKARYHDMTLRCKMMQCCAAVDNLVKQMDFDAAWKERLAGGTPGSAAPANSKLLQLQMDAVREIRKCVDCTHHVQVGRDPNRALVPDVGQLATYGQFHCHGMASVVAGVLMPLCTVLGLDVRQRDGMWVRNSPEWDGRPIASADHTWLEVTFHPSGANFVCDPSFSPHSEPTLLPFQDAYWEFGSRYPTRDLQSAHKNRALMDSKNCLLPHEDHNESGSDVKNIAAMKPLAFQHNNSGGGSDGKLCFV